MKAFIAIERKRNKKNIFALWRHEWRLNACHLLLQKGHEVSMANDGVRKRKEIGILVN